MFMNSVAALTAEFLFSTSIKRFWLWLFD